MEKAVKKIKSDDIIKQAKSIVNKPQKTTRKDMEFYPSGITLLDLCLGGGFGKGYISNIVGGNSSGKTMFACETIGYNNHHLENFKHKIDNAESGFTLNTQFLFNFKADLVSPRSKLVEHFKYNVEKVLKTIKNDNYIYVLDSLDGLSDEGEQKKHKEKMAQIKKKIEEDKDEKGKGDYGASKAKGMSSFFRILNSKVNKTKMHLMVISQVRDKIGVMFGKKQIRSGGNALDFYATHIIWLYTIRKNEVSIKIDSKIFKRIVDNLVKVVVEKSKLGTPSRSCYLFINPKIGIDNIKSNIYFLYNLITPKGELRNDDGLKWDEKDENTYNVNDLIKYIEDNNLESELEKRVITLWNEIEKKASPERKRKYK
jgi:RecA/RadA recombinase